LRLIKLLQRLLETTTQHYGTIWGIHLFIHFIHFFTATHVKTHSLSQIIYKYYDYVNKWKNKH